MHLNRAFFVLILIGFCFSVQARLSLPEPEALMQQAQQSRTELRAVLFNIEKNIGEMSSQVLFEKYFFLLDRLQYLAQQLSLDEIYPDAVQSLGVKMVTHGQKWLDIRFNSKEKILFYHKYSNYDLASNYFLQISYTIGPSKEVSEIKRIMPILESLYEWAKTHYSDEKNLQLSYESLISDFATQFLTSETIADQDFSYWASKILSVNAYTHLILRFSNQLFEITRESHNQLPSFVYRILTLRNQFAKSPHRTNETIQVQFSNLLLELTLLCVRYEIFLTQSQFEEILTCLSRRDLMQLSYSWFREEETHSTKYLEAVIAWSLSLIKRLKEERLHQEAIQIEKELKKISTSFYAKKFNIEGRYLLHDKDGKSKHFTIIQKNKKSFIAAFSSEKHFILKSLFNIEVSLPDLVFHASEREGDIDGSSNTLVSFRLTEKDSIEVKDLSSFEGIKTYRGKKIEQFKNYYFKEDSRSSHVPEGVYSGKIKLTVNQQTYLARLILLSINGNLMGRLLYPNVNIDFNYGEETYKNVFYLTTGKIPRSDSWIHLRLQIKEQKIKGYLISALWGKTTEEFIFDKISNTTEGQ